MRQYFASLGFVFFAATALYADISGALLKTDLSSLGLFALDTLEVWERTNLFADAIGGEDLVSFRSHNQIAATIWAPGKIALLDHSHKIWGDIYYGTLTEAAPQYNQQVGGRYPLGTGDWLYRQIEAKSVPYGTQDIWEGWGNAIDLAPGQYRDVEVRYPSSIRLSSGVYHFRRLSLMDFVSITYDVTNGPIYVNVDQELLLRQSIRNEFVPSVAPFSLNWYTNQSTQLDFVGHDNLHYGLVVAPNARVHVGQRVNFVGAIHARSIWIEPDGEVCVPPTLQDLWHSEGAMAPWFNPWHSEYTAVVRPGVESLHFDARAPGGMVVDFSENDFAPTGTKEVIVTLTDPARAQELPGCAQSKYRVKIEVSPQYQLFVNEASPCQGTSCDGSSWNKAFAKLQNGLDRSMQVGKEVWVAAGTYRPEKEYVTGDSRTRSFYLGSGADVRGGFAGTENEIEERKRMPYEIVLQGNGTARTVVVDGGAPHFDKFTIESGSTPLWGGGAWIASGQVRFNNLVFKNNSAAQGGAIALSSGASVEIENSYIYNNSATQSGGAIQIGAGSQASALNSLFFGNISQNGAGIASGAGNLSLQFVTAYDNGSSCIATAGTLTIWNSILWGSGCGISAGSENLLSNNLMGRSASNENRAVNPKFLNQAAPLGEDGWPGTLDDGLQLAATSPMIDVGRFINNDTIPYDFFGIDRAIDGNGDGFAQPDLGAMEHYSTSTEIIAGRYINGEFVAWPKVPVVSLDYLYQVVHYMKSEQSVVLKVLAPKQKDAKKIKTAYGYIQGFTPQGAPLPNTTPQKVTFYKVEEEGKVFFVTKKADGEGVSLAFLDQPRLQGEIHDYINMMDPPITWIEWLDEVLGYAIHFIPGSTLQIRVPHEQFR